MESVGGLFCTSWSPSMVAPLVPPQLEHGELPAQTAPPIPTPEATSAAPPTTPTTLTTTHSALFQQMAEIRAHQTANCYSPPDSAAPQSPAFALA
ncbi:hypothetical protein CK203_063411 [Vitis vinifera]|uniref:Uncharacterized protein n=1 Tax=Vitis vinifera TaxID=29760 RepID=A0A438G8Z0_VITVI|nr:hypothetical protein CK203_063411 [Vitis vinifera]